MRIRYVIDPALCRRCDACRNACPQECIERTSEGAYAIDERRCSGCGTCAEACKLRAIAKKRRLFF